VPIIQKALDTYREYWNNHTITKFNKKKNPSGSCPNNMFLNPTSVRPTARDCHIKVDPRRVVELREAHGGQAAREKAYVFVSEELKL
jgi:hypothetical protein